ncbi:MAG: hypothetical protein LAP39_10240 [Acidobacteriia bacterium]|nr:hypothetical protein [Terriglobia bacterium]
MNRLFALCAVGILPILHGQIQIFSPELPRATVGAGYYFAIETGVSGRCPSSDMRLFLIDGKLPRGIEIAGTALVGTPREIGTSRFSIRAANICSSTVKTFELVVTGKAILRVFPEQLSFEYHAGQAGPPPQVVQVSSTWPNLPYLIHMDDDWLTQKPRAGITPGEGSGLSSDTVSVEVASKSLAPGVYRTVIRFSTWSGADSPAVAVTLNVLP